MGMGAVRFSAVVLAAGASTRMAGRHKLLLPLGGETVIRRTVRAVLGANPQEAVVVTGSNADAVTNALAGLGAKVLFNARHAEGQMTSVAAGVAALEARCDAVMVCLGDMALLESADYSELADAFAAQSRAVILLPWRDGIRGNPVVFASSFIPEVLAGSRNLGCRKLIADHPEDVHAYEPHHDRFFIDLDTPEDYARLRDRLGLPVERAADVS
jgi:molybdenum cofactor cytidylyltransferase